MRALVYNVKGFRAGPSSVADAVRDLRPDIAFITEAGRTRQLKRFAEELGLSAHHGSLVPVVRRARNAILVREPLSVVHSESHLFASSARFHPRGAFIAGVSAEGQLFTTMVVHLGLSGAERVRHARELIALVGDAVRPVLVGGDLNENPHGPAAAAVASVGRDAWTGTVDGATFPSENPVARIDYLFTSEDVKIEEAFVPEGSPLRQASDHLPLVVDLDL